MANMTNGEFTRLLTKAAKAADKHKLLVSRVNDECIARYGVDYGSVDADTIIDTLNYIGGDSFSEKQFHEAMLLSGCDRIDVIAEQLRALPKLTDAQQAQLEEIESQINSV